MPTQKKYYIRCSPDCPYEWCRIEVSEPTQQQGEGGDSEESDQSNGDSSNGSKSNNSKGGASNSSSQQPSNSDSQSSDGAQSQNDASDRDGPGSSSSQTSNGGNGSGDRDSQNDDADSSDDDRSTDSSSEDGGRDDQSADQDDDSGADEEGSGDGSSSDSSGVPENEEQSDQQEGSTESDGSDGNSDETETEEESQSAEAEESEPADSEPVEKARPEKVAPYQPVFDPNGALPDGIIGGGSSAGHGDTDVVDLGKHGKREEVLSDNTFNARLRSVMKDNAYDRRVKGRKRGRLDMKSLYKVAAKSESVFTLKEARKNKHYNVVILIDQSGSMYGWTANSNPAYQRAWDEVLRRYERDEIDVNEAIRLRDEDLVEQYGGGRLIDIATDATTFLAKSFGKVQVKTSVIGYSDGYLVHKKLDTDFTEDKLKKLAYDLRHTGNGGTSLRKPLNAAFAELRKHPTEKNIVICVSDGQPYEPNEQMIHIIKSNAHVADFIDIGIQSTPIMDNGIRIDNVEELKPLLIRELKKRIKRG